MNIQPINNVSFCARIKLNKCSRMLREFSDIKAVSESSKLKASSPQATVATTSNVSGPIFETVGSAFSAQQVGLDSFGIAPAVMEELTPEITANTALVLEKAPSILGTSYSSLGAMMQKMGKVDVKSAQNIPS